ncbi:MAG: metallophosphoesterase [Ruminococcus sp.]|nr:metallophosphoesterase [Ruminococcus sp.]
MKKIFKILLCVILVCAVLLTANAIYCTNTIETKVYDIQTDKLKTSVKFVFISDLHNKEYGEKNADLVAKIKAQNPDFIAVGGDMVTRTKADDTVMKELLPQLAEIAPTYCVLGNHELDLSDQIDFTTDINNTGAVLLDNESIEFEKDNETILIGGLSDYPYYEGNTEEKEFWESFYNNQTNYFTVLLHHQPEFIKSFGYDCNIDLIMSGHTHGGQIQIPFIGGVFAPNQGLFPKYDKGEFDLENGKLIISAGLGDAYPLPRINNCHDMIVVQIN